jgi:DNA-binding PadR family transcriptional regulator
MKFTNIPSRGPRPQEFDPFELESRFGMHRFGGRGGGRRRHSHGGFGQSERGSLKYDVLAILAEGPRHGYEIMGAIEERRGFRPSPGSIYPALQMLDEGDFLDSREVDGKRVYSITETGKAMLDEHLKSPEGAGDTSSQMAGLEIMGRGIRTLHSLREAVKAIARSGDIEMISRAVDILTNTRRELYALLAEEK